jgi:hypothetical protein
MIQKKQGQNKNEKEGGNEERQKTKIKKGEKGENAKQKK